MFTQRHYEFLARFFKWELSVAIDSGDEVRIKTTKGLIRLLASEFAHDNKKFDKFRFFSAIGNEVENG